MYIYKVTNQNNGKIYVGQCTKSVEKSIGYFGSGTMIKRAIETHGKQNFTKYILRDNIKTQRELDIWEYFYIVKLKSTDTKIGYNIVKGTTNKFAHGSPMLIESVRLKTKQKVIDFFKTEKGKQSAKNAVKKSLKTKRENGYFDFLSETMKETMKGELNHNYGNKWSEEQKQDLALKMRGRFCGENNANFGNKWTHAQKQSLRKKNSQILYMFDKNKQQVGVFQGSAEAFEMTGIPRGSITNSAIKPYKKLAREHYFVYEKDLQNN